MKSKTNGSEGRTLLRRIQDGYPQNRTKSTYTQTPLQQNTPDIKGAVSVSTEKHQQGNVNKNETQSIIYFKHLTLVYIF